MPSYSGLYDGVYGQPYALLSDTVAKGNVQTQLSRLLARRLYGRARYRELIEALVSGAVGAPALAVHERVKAERDLTGNDQGGLRTIETFTAISRATTADDQTNIENALEQLSAPSSYPTDASGNGGGGKLGF